MPSRRVVEGTVVTMAIESDAVIEVVAKTRPTTQRGIEARASMWRGQIVQATIIRQGIEAGTAMQREVEARTISPRALERLKYATCPDKRAIKTTIGETRLR